MSEMTDNSSMDLSLTNIWQSWRAFRAGKKPSRDILTFESRLEANLLLLCHELNKGTYRHNGYTHRIINEKKRRDISVAHVRDRVLHRLLYDYLVPIIDARLDFDVWSCRPGKGLHAGLDRTSQLMQTYPDAWVWRADVIKFFDNVNHTILSECLERLISDQKALSLLDKVIESYPSQLEASQPASQPASQRGIPIGNLTSQIFANIYMNEFDRFVRQQIKPLAYVRYGDDFVLFASSEQKVCIFKEIATDFLGAGLGLKIHQRDAAVKVSHGLHFLGSHVYANKAVPEPAQISKIYASTNILELRAYKARPKSKKLMKQYDWLLLRYIKNAQNK